MRTHAFLSHACIRTLQKRDPCPKQTRVHLLRFGSFRYSHPQNAIEYEKEDYHEEYDKEQLRG